MNSRVILLAEDRDDDVFITCKALRDVFIQNPINVVKDGEQAIAYLSDLGKFGPPQTIQTTPRASSLRIKRVQQLGYPSRSALQLHNYTYANASH